MQATALRLPDLRQLYFCDLYFKRAAHTVVGALLLSAGTYWVMYTGDPNRPLEPSPERAAAPYIVAGGPVVAAVAALLLALRRRRINAVLSRGVRVNGRVESLETYSRQKRTEHSSAFGGSTAYSYYANIVYDFNGIAYRKSFKLPLSPSSCGVRKDHPVELMLHAEAPEKPLIRQIYLGAQA